MAQWISIEEAAVKYGFEAEYLWVLIEMREIMLLQLFSLYFESLILTTILVLIFLGIWIGLRAMSGVDKTAKARQAHLYDMIMIGVLVVPVLSFAVMSLILVFKA